eukprot:jgi/Picre1/35155/NNA_002617.t1
MTECPTLIIAGSSTAVGKSSVSLGLMAALSDGNTSVQAFKVGPGGSEDLLPFSTAQVAKWLNVPVVLVMDGSKLENSIGALVRGYCTWDKGVRIAGIIFNNVGRQDDLVELEAIVNNACPHEIPILGGIPLMKLPQMAPSSLRSIHR